MKKLLVVILAMSSLSAFAKEFCGTVTEISGAYSVIEIVMQNQSGKVKAKIKPSLLPIATAAVSSKLKTCAFVSAEAENTGVIDDLTISNP